LSSISPQQAWKVFEQADLLHSADAIEAALDAIAASVTARLSGTNPLLVCILTGGVVPFGKLLPRLQFPLTIDYVHATRYGDKLHGGQLHWISGPQVDPVDRTVLLVDDILDEGTTIAGIEERYVGDGARAVYKTVLITKDRKRAQDVHIDFPGLTVPDRYVFGYGMDYKGYLRNAPGIYAEAEK